MPAWGTHLYVAKKVSQKIKIEDYNSFLIGNIAPDFNNGHLIKDVSKIFSHKQTHYCDEYQIAKDGKLIYYDIDKFVKDNKENITNSAILGYAVHILTDDYWNSLTYDKHGIKDENDEIIGLKLNDGTNLIADKVTRRKTKQSDFKIFADYIYRNNLIDIPKYEEDICESLNKISVIEIIKDDVEKAIQYLDSVKDGLELKEKEYKIYTQEEMEDEIEKCVDNIVSYYKNNIEKGV